MDKRILKKIAKEWCKAILIANDSTSNDEMLLTEEEMGYVLEESTKIANRIYPDYPLASFNDIVRKHYNFNP